MDNLPTRPPGTKPGKRPGNQFGRQLHGHTNSIPVEERLRRTQELLADDLVLQRLAKQMVESGFRNRLEDIHAGIIPSSKTGDGTDIVVTLFLAKITIGCRIKYINRVSNSALSHVKLALCSAHLDSFLFSILDSFTHAAICSWKTWHCGNSLEFCNEGVLNRGLVFLTNSSG